MWCFCPGYKLNSTSFTPFCFNIVDTPSINWYGIRGSSVPWKNLHSECSPNQYITGVSFVASWTTKRLALGRHPQKAITPPIGSFRLNAIPNKKARNRTRMKRDARSLAKTTQNDVLWIDALLYFLLNQRVHHFATFLHSFAIVVSLEAPGGEVKPGMLQSTLATP